MKCLCTKVSIPVSSLLLGCLLALAAWADSNETLQVASPAASERVTAQNPKLEEDLTSVTGHPQPADGCTVTTALITLDWDDIQGATRYEVYFGTHANPGRGDLRGIVSLSQWPVNIELVPATVYYWRIVAKNPYGETTGRVWRFTTAAISPPALPSAPVPADGQTSVGLSLVALDWADAGGAKSYSVFFGTKPELGLGQFKGNFSLSRWRLDCLLAPATEYYWRIVALNAYGSTTGSVWRFTTQGASRPSGL